MDAWIPHVFSRQMHRVRGCTVSLGAVEYREFDVSAPTCCTSYVNKHIALCFLDCDIYIIFIFDLIIQNKVQFLCDTR